MLESVAVYMGAEISVKTQAARDPLTDRAKVRFALIGDGEDDWDSTRGLPQARL
jgi:hypothetical protein